MVARWSTFLKNAPLAVGFGVGMLWVVLGIVPADAATDPVVAKVSLDLAQQRASLRSFQVKYTHRITFDEAAKQRGLDRSTSTNIESFFAFKGENRITKKTETRNSAAGRGSRIEQTSLFNSDRGICIIIQPKTVVIQKKKSSHTELNSYTPDLGWVVTAQDRLMVESDPYKSGYLPACLSHPDWRVGRERPIVRGRRCLVLENLTLGDQLSLDPERGYAMVRRERTNLAAGVASNTADYFDFVRVAPRLWLPTRIERTVKYRDKSTQQPAGENRAVMTVEKISANDVPDGMFSIPKLKPGVGVIDQINKITYIHDEGIATLDHSLKNSRFAVTSARPESRTGVLLPLVLSQAILVLGAVILLLLRRRRSRGEAVGVRRPLA